MDNKKNILKIEKTLILTFVGMVLGILGLVVSLAINKEGNIILAAFFAVLLVVSVITTIVGMRMKKQ